MIDKLLHFSACGLIYDAFGVLLIGFAFFFKTKEAIILEAGTYWDSNPHVLRSIIASKFDGMAGTVLLFIGFIYQMLGYIKIHYSPVIIGSYLLLFVFLAVYFTNFRARKISEWHEALLQKSERE